jgi:hypothetical protein
MRGVLKDFKDYIWEKMKYPSVTLDDIAIDVLSEEEVEALSSWCKENDWLFWDGRKKGWHRFVVLSKPDSGR